MVRNTRPMKQAQFLFALIGLPLFGLAFWNAFAVWQFHHSNETAPALAQSRNRTANAAERYGVTDLGTSGANYVYHGGDVNDSHIVVGTGVDQNNQWTAFRWQAGRLDPMALLTQNALACALAINNRNVAVGYSGQAPVQWIGKAALSLPLPAGCLQGEALGVNDRNQIVGCACGLAGDMDWWKRPTVPVEWDGRVVKRLPVPEGYRSASAYAINNAGTVAGWAITQDDRTHAVVWQGSRMVDLGAFSGGRVSRATAINEQGWVVGSAEKAPIGPIVFGKPSRPNVHSFLWRDGVMSDLGVPRSAIYCVATSINNGGIVVGKYSTINISDRRGFVWDSTHGSRDLSGLIKSRDWFIQDAFAINNAGEILVFGTPRQRGGNRYSHLLLLTPSN